MDRPYEDGTAPTPVPVPWRGYARGPRTALTIGLLLLGAGLLVHHFLSVDWSAMRGVMSRLPGRSLAIAGLLSVASYAVYCCFDLLARRTTGHGLAPSHVLAIGFVGHACGLSLGPAGAGVRFRLYAHHGLPMHLIAALWLFNVFTNWLGFVLVAGVALAAGMLSLPAHWGIAGDLVRWGGVAMLGGVATYVVACRIGRHHSFRLRGVEFRLPPPWVASLQCVLSALNWLLLAAIIYVLLQERPAFAGVLGALMASALALAVVDVPAGIGVLETVFVALLGRQVPTAELLGALLAYRAIYFVVPLLLSGPLYIALEWHAHTRR